MKKLIPILSLLLLAALLCSCGLLPSGDPDVTTAGGPTLADMEEGIRAAAPTQSSVTVAVRYREPAVTLTSHIVMKKNASDAYYTYEAERLLPTEEALLAGSPIGKVEGYLQLSGNQVVASSAEVDAELLAGVSSLSINLPRLDPSYFSDCRITEENGGVTLSATVKEDKLGDMLDKSAAISDLSFTLTLTEDLTPTALTARFVSDGGAAVTYTAEYSYTPVTIP